MILSRPLGLGQGQTVAIVGSGGKTTLLLHLATEWSHKRVLVSTTSRLRLKELDGADHFYSTEEQWRSPSPTAGVHVAGIVRDGMLLPLPASQLDSLRKQFDLTLLECDFANGLPLKGWRRDRPPVPDYTDLTIGVTSAVTVGQPIGDSTVYQKGLFTIMSGARTVDTLTLEHIAAMITHQMGLFHSAQGRRILFINQADDEAAVNRGKQLVTLLPEDFLRTLDCVVVGSVRENRCIYLATAMATE